MIAPAWYDAAPGHAGVAHITATRRAFRCILITMMPPSMRAEFFGDRECQS